MNNESTTVYCARWKEYGGGWAESLVSWADLDVNVFGRAYAPSRSNVSFSTRQESQGVS
mgnify:FL=1